MRAAVISTVAYTKENDAGSYQNAANNLSRHGTFTRGDDGPPVPSAYRPPGYPFFVFVLQSVTRTDWGGLRTVQVLMSVATSLLLAWSLGRWYPRARRAALWMLCLNPFDGYYAGAMLSETLSATIVTAAVLVLVAPLRLRLRLLIAGLVLGLGALTRDQLVLLPLAFALSIAWLSWRGPRRWKRFRALALLPVMTGLVILPWTVRNFVHFEKLIPISAGRLGYNLWLGTWERDAQWNLGPTPVYPDYAFNDDAERAEVERIGLGMYTDEGDRDFRKLAIKRMKEHPLRTIAAWIRRAPAIWFGTRNDLFAQPWLVRGSKPWLVVKSAHWGLNFLLVVAGLSAFRLLRGSRRLRALTVLVGTPVLYTAAIYFPLHSIENRYSHPVLQCLVALAALNLAALWAAWSARRQVPFFSPSP